MFWPITLSTILLPFRSSDWPGPTVCACIGGDGLDGSQSDPSTSGVHVFSGTVPVNVTIAHNVLFDNTYGIWEGVRGNVSPTLAGNRFFGVGTPVFTQP